MSMSIDSMKNYIVSNCTIIAQVWNIAQVYFEINWKKKPIYA